MKKNSEKKEQKKDKVFESRRNEFVIYALKNRTFWRTLAIAMIMVFIACLCLIYVILKNPERNIPPYVVELNTASGETIIRDKVYTVNNYDAKPLLMENIVRSFIVKMRSVSTDNEINRQNLLWLKTHIEGTECINKINSYLTDNNPIERSAKEKVKVSIINVQPLKAEGIRYLVDWNEIAVNPRNDSFVYEKNYRCEIEAKQFKPTNDTKMDNPLGFYITYYDVSPIYSYSNEE